MWPITRILVVTIIFSPLCLSFVSAGRHLNINKRFTITKTWNTTITRTIWHVKNSTAASSRGKNKENRGANNGWNTNQTSNTNDPSLEFPGPLANEFLAAHNGIRISKGAPALTWDKGLAVYAQRWAQSHMQDCKMEHSHGPYGENLFWGSSDHWTPTQAVQSWIDEQKDYDANKNTCRPGQMCGHYTQVVWKNTLRVGCVRQKCNTGGTLVVCNYDPPGNYANQNPFG